MGPGPAARRAAATEGAETEGAARDSSSGGGLDMSGVNEMLDQASAAGTSSEKADLLIAAIGEMIDELTGGGEGGASGVGGSDVPSEGEAMSGGAEAEAASDPGGVATEAAGEAPEVEAMVPLLRGLAELSNTIDGSDLPEDVKSALLDAVGSLMETISAMMTGVGEGAAPAGGGRSEAPEDAMSGGEATEGAEGASAAGGDAADPEPAPMVPFLQGLADLSDAIAGSDLPEDVKNALLDAVGSLMETVASVMGGDEGAAAEAPAGESVDLEAAQVVPFLQGLAELSDAIDSSSLPEDAKNALLDAVGSLMETVSSTIDQDTGTASMTKGEVASILSTTQELVSDVDESLPEAAGAEGGASGKSDVLDSLIEGVATIAAAVAQAFSGSEAPEGQMVGAYDEMSAQG